MGRSFERQKKGITVTNAFRKALYEPNCKPKKIWVHKCSDFSDRSMKSSLQGTDVEGHSTRNERKCVVPENFIITFKNKIYKYMKLIKNCLQMIKI